MLAADTQMQVGVHAAAQLAGHIHQLADALLIQLGEGIVLVDLLVVVGAEELARVVAREAEGHLREVVRAEAEELRLLRELAGDERGARHLDHRADLVVELDLGGLDLVVRDVDDDVLHELELLRVARERNHDLGAHVPALVAALHADRRADDGLRLHDGDLRVRHAEAAATVAHHRVELVEGIDDLLDAADRLVRRLREKRDLVLGVRHELVERRVEEADGDRAALESLIELLEIALLHRCVFSHVVYNLLIKDILRIS
mgnify:CR=1 FL=1